MPIILLAIIMIITIVVIIVDKDRESDTNHTFSGGNLFYKYGQVITNTTIAIAVEGNNPKPLYNIAEDLLSYVANEIKQQFSSLGDRFNTDIILVTDRKMPADQRKFIKTSIVTKRGSEITYFILVVGVGRQIVVHEFLFLKGKTKWTTVFWFVVTSPLHIWFWFYPWIMKNHSVYVSLRNSYNKSSYDTIDILTILRGLSLLFSTKLKSFAKKEGLLTEDLSIVLNQNISNSQTVNISNSKKVSLSGIAANIKASGN